IDGGNCVGIRGIAVDMTRHVQTEDRLKAYTEELKEVNAMKDKFFSIIAHDLRAPFTGFLGFTELLHQEVDNMSKEEISHFAGILKNSAKNNYELLENLLQWGRLQTGALEIKNERIEITNCISNVLRLLQYNIENKQISVESNLNSPVYAKGDCQIVQSVLQNLLSNSIKFTNRNGKISIECGQNDGKVFVTVRDNGVGISGQILEKLFRLDSHITTQGTEKETGTGLGLLVCREMIEKINGKIEIESRVNEGTAVTFCLHRDE
ncbi:MAG: HAMP domain-containing histidine kinase, partial [Bacteroidetes bacterium]|nr:HAMP domain-containing histidine kinase [Bacteroidota bacterium]